MSPCERLESHLSALADGALEPLEAIALRRHLATCAACQARYDAVEELKLRVHVATRDDAPSELARARWKAALEARALDRRAAARGRGLWPAAALAAAALLAAALLWPGAREGAAPPTPDAVAVRPALDDGVLDRMARIHRGEAAEAVLDDLVRAGALVTFESLPATFITPEAERRRVVLASYGDCVESETGSSLAVLRRGAISLPTEVEAALASAGTWFDDVGGVEVRVSASGDKVFVLLSLEAPTREDTAI